MMYSLTVTNVALVCKGKMEARFDVQCGPFNVRSCILWSGPGTQISGPRHKKGDKYWGTDVDILAEYVPAIVALVRQQMSREYRPSVISSDEYVARQQTLANAEPVKLTGPAASTAKRRTFAEIRQATYA